MYFCSICIRYDWYNSSGMACTNCGGSQLFTSEGVYQCGAVNKYGVAMSNRTHYQAASKLLL